MSTTAGNFYIPGVRPTIFATNTAMGRFGSKVAGFGPNRGLGWLHNAGMHGAGAHGGWGGIYPSFGIGREGLLDFASYSTGGGRTLGGISGGIEGGFRAQARGYAELAGDVARGRIAGASRRAMAGSLAMRAIAPAFLAYGVYEGYQEGGVSGGVKGGATYLAQDYAIGVALRAAGAMAMPVALAAGVASAGYAGFKLLQAGKARHERTKRLELGRPVVDPFGNSATMRQRSLQALQGSQINGRSAFGSEAQLMRIPYMR